MLIRMKYLHQKVAGGAYYFRRRIPTDLIDKAGKETVFFSLKTKEPIKAQAIE